MEFLIVLIIILLIYLNWSRIQAWLALKLIQRVQRSMMDAAAQQQRAQQQRRSSTEGNAGTSTGGPQRGQKQQLDEIEARKFSRPSQDDYVDFEELPK